MPTYRRGAKFFDRILMVLLWPTLLLSFGGYMADWHWRLAWYSNPRAHFLAFALFALLWFGARRQWRWALLATVVLVPNVVAVAPFYMAPEPQPRDPTYPTLTLAHLNTNRGQADLAPMLKTGADVLFLQEVTPESAPLIPVALPGYTLVISQPMSNTHGSAILVKRDARIRVSSAQVIHLPAESSRPLLTTSLLFRGYGVRLLNLHLTRPANFWGDAFQKVELAAVGSWRNPALSGNTWREIADGYHVHSLMVENGPLIVVGDFNVTPWSPRFQRLLREARLEDSMRGFGSQNSWPSILPLPLGIPIDHALHSPSLTTLDRKTIRVAGTDHALLVVTFGF